MNLLFAIILLILFIMAFVFLAALVTPSAYDKEQEDFEQIQFLKNSKN